MSTQADRHVDVRCYVVIDPAACRGRDSVQVAQAAARGGATIIQLRDKRREPPAIRELARRMQQALAPFGIPFIVNDHVRIAEVVGAAGVHVGQGDMPVEDVRALLGDEAIIGLSHKRAEEIAASPVALLSYAAIGNIFPTSSKDQGMPPSGIEGFAGHVRQMRARRADLPIVAIAGITADNAADVIAAGADGVAVISAVCAADDPEAATRALREVVDAALRERTA